MYGHKFKPIEPNELVNFDGVVVNDGVCNGSVGEMYWRWLDGSDYDEVITESINKSHWLQINRTIKLNNNTTSPKRGDPGNNPTYKIRPAVHDSGSQRQLHQSVCRVRSMR